MLTKQQRQIITYENIKIYEKTYQLPILKNPKLKIVQKKITGCQILIKEGVRYHHYFGGIIKRKEKINQKKIFQEIKLLIKDYIHLIDFLETYKDSYQEFLLKLTDDWKVLFTQKYLEIKKLNEERKKLESKNIKNPQVLNKLKSEKQENLKSVLLLSNINFLMLEKVKLLSEGIKNLSEDTKNQKQTIQEIVKELEVYEEIYEYQTKATKIRQEIAKIAETAINFEKPLQDYFNPFQLLIDEVVKVDESFYATVGDIKGLADNILQSQSNLFSVEETDTISKNFLNFMVASYEKKDRLRDAFIESKLLDWQTHIFDLNDENLSLERAIYLISTYLSDEIADQRNILGINEKNIVTIKSLSGTEEVKIQEVNHDDILLTKEFNISRKINYDDLQNFLVQQMWKEADIETTKLMLQVMGKNYWNEVYQEDIDNFSCQSLQTIDQFWKQYSHGYFGFSVQQTTWSEIGGQIDYESQKRLGDRLGWRKEGNWLDYDELTFKLSSTTPMGHLPAKWLHYDQDTFNLYPNSLAEPFSMGAWRVESWLVWQMHLFFSRVQVCNINLP